MQTDREGPAEVGARTKGYRFQREMVGVYRVAAPNRGEERVRAMPSSCTHHGRGLRRRPSEVVSVDGCLTPTIR